MTYPIYKKDEKWYRTYKEVDCNPDEVIYVELSDSIYDNEHSEPTLAELLKLKDNYGKIGMFSLDKLFNWNTYNFS